MSDPKGFYKALGIEPGASEAEIKKAYRRKAMQCHPDRPGADAEQFKRINEAHALLIDKTRRHQYDTDGVDISETLIQQRATTMLQDFFMQYLDKGGDEDDPITIITTSIASGKGEIRKEIEQSRRQLARYQKRLKAIRRKNKRGMDLFAGVVEMKINTTKAHIGRGEEQIQIFDACAQLVKDYEFVPPPPSPSPDMYSQDHALDALAWWAFHEFTKK